ncbi:MAG TPA: response regulator [Gemmatimonadales bacterium]|nr:response regulator [Gemmatimonadales bacterium]
MNQMREGEILLVDDREEDVALALRALRRHDLAGRMVVARDGVEALELLLPDSLAEAVHFLPRVIPLDLKLPRLSGVEVLRRLKQDERTRAVPVVALASSDQEAEIAICCEFGVNSYIVKPVEFEAFARAVGDPGTY